MCRPRTCVMDGLLLRSFGDLLIAESECNRQFHNLLLKIQFTFLHVQAEEADVDAVDLLEGVEGALPEWERLAHLVRVHEPGTNDIKDYFSPKTCLERLDAHSLDISSA